jgi:hypothetical protein
MIEPMTTDKILVQYKGRTLSFTVFAARYETTPLHHIYTVVTIEAVNPNGLKLRLQLPNMADWPLLALEEPK